MDHEHIQDIGLFLILEDSFSGWLEVIKVRDRKVTTVRQILRTIFTSNGVTKTIVTDNAPEFCDESLVLRLRKIGSIPYKTPPYHPQSNGIAERMVQTLKMGLKVLLSYRTVPHVDRKQSPSALMGRQNRTPINATKEKVWYKRN